MLPLEGNERERAKIIFDHSSPATALRSLPSSLPCSIESAMDADPLVKTLRQAFVQTLSSNPVSLSSLPRERAKSAQRGETRIEGAGDDDWRALFVCFFSLTSTLFSFLLLFYYFHTAGKHQAGRGIAQAHRGRPWIRHRAAQGKEEEREKATHSSSFSLDRAIPTLTS